MVVMEKIIFKIRDFFPFLQPYYEKIIFKIRDFFPFWQPYYHGHLEETYFPIKKQTLVYGCYMSGAMVARSFRTRAYSTILIV